jgi:Tfp pilus assembly protein PilF
MGHDFLGRTDSSLFFLVARVVVTAAVFNTVLAGCQHTASPGPSSLLTADMERTAKPTAAQIADLQIAEGRALEKRGDLVHAVAAYHEALRHDPQRPDACLRLAILLDQQGKFKEALQFYEKALAGIPGNPDVYCDRGYSLYLQERYGEAEMNLRQAIALAPEHARAHNNLGLVLARKGRTDEALLEFRRAGCKPADGHSNLAYVLALDRHWPEARRHYQQALALDPNSPAALKGLKELDALAMRDPTDPLATAAAEAPQ